jgi:hypothetical protein
MVAVVPRAKARGDGSSRRSVIYRFSAPLWIHQGESAWHFLTLPFDQADEIEASAAGARKGFGSVRVRVTIGGTTWSTSLFPDSKAESYVLPVKKQVRLGEGLEVGDDVDVELEVIEV